MVRNALWLLLVCAVGVSTLFDRRGIFVAAAAVNAGVATRWLGGSGSGDSGTADGVGFQARFNVPVGCVVDGTRAVFVSDSGNHVVRRAAMRTSNVTTFVGIAGVAGGIDGVGSAARLRTPTGLALSANGQTLYVAESDNHLVRAVNLATAEASLYVGNGAAGYLEGVGVTAQLHLPSGLAVHRATARLYVGEVGTYRIRVFSPTAVSSVLAGDRSAPGSVDGVGTSARFVGPHGIAIEYGAGGGALWVADRFANRLKTVALGGGAAVVGTVRTVVGDGAAAYTDGVGGQAALNGPFGVAVSEASPFVYVSTEIDHRVRRVHRATLRVDTVVNSDGLSSLWSGSAESFRARVHAPRGVCLDADDALYVVGTNAVLYVGRRAYSHSLTATRTVDPNAPPPPSGTATASSTAAASSAPGSTTSSAIASANSTTTTSTGAASSTSGVSTMLTLFTVVDPTSTLAQSSTTGIAPGTTVAPPNATIQPPATFAPDSISGGVTPTLWMPLLFALVAAVSWQALLTHAA